jgi:hypothetical protein
MGGGGGGGSWGWGCARNIIETEVRCTRNGTAMHCGTTAATLKCLRLCSDRRVARRL